MTKRHMSTTELASPATRRKGIRATLMTAMTGGAGLGILVLLFLASVGYFVFGGAPRNERASSAPVAPSDYFPATYGNRGRDGDGNVMTYEHD